MIWYNLLTKAKESSLKLSLPPNKNLMRNYCFLFLVLTAFACTPSQKTGRTQQQEKKETIVPEPKIYRGAYTRVHELVHTKLEVKPDFVKKQLYGKATITLHHHFYPCDSVVLNARGMDIHSVSLVKKDGSKVQTPYSYDNSKIIYVWIASTPVMKILRCSLTILQSREGFAVSRSPCHHPR